MVTIAGVDILRRLNPIVVRALARMEAARKRALERAATLEMVVTSGAEGFQGDGVHGKQSPSLHYPENCPGGLGLAVDIRTRDVLGTIVEELRKELGAGWDVVLEADHIHVERDYKKVPLEGGA